MNDKYFITDWTFNRVLEHTGISASGSITATAIITDELMNSLDSLCDGGSALVTNNIKEYEFGSVIESVGRDGNCIAVIFKHAPHVWEIKDDELSVIAEALIENVATNAFKWVWPPKPTEVHPLFASGGEYKPDSMYGRIDELLIQYDQKKCFYTSLIPIDVFNKYVKPHFKYFSRILRDIMKCNGVCQYNNTLICYDKNTGTGPTLDRAKAISFSVLFVLLSVINMYDLLEKKEE